MGCGRAAPAHVPATATTAEPEREPALPPLTRIRGCTARNLVLSGDNAVVGCGDGTLWRVTLLDTIASQPEVIGHGGDARGSIAVDSAFAYFFMGTGVGRAFVAGGLRFLIAPHLAPRALSLLGKDLFVAADGKLYSVDVPFGPATVIATIRTPVALTAYGEDVFVLDYADKDRRIFAVNRPTGSVQDLGPATGALLLAGGGFLYTASDRRPVAGGAAEPHPMTQCTTAAGDGLGVFLGCGGSIYGRRHDGPWQVVVAGTRADALAASPTRVCWIASRGADSDLWCAGRPASLR